MTLSVTIERFFAIAHPLKQYNLKGGLIVGSVAMSLAYNLPRFFELTTVDREVQDPSTGENYTVSFVFGRFLLMGNRKENLP